MDCEEIPLSATGSNTISTTFATGVLVSICALFCLLCCGSSSTEMPTRRATIRRRITFCGKVLNRPAYAELSGNSLVTQSGSHSYFSAYRRGSSVERPASGETAMAILYLPSRIALDLSVACSYDTPLILRRSQHAKEVCSLNTVAEP